MILADPTPVTVDVSRDWLDWFNAVSVPVSLLIAVAALWLAYRAYRDGKVAEVRAIERQAAERARVFELEVLRELADATDSRSAISHDHSTRVALLPDGELSEWHRWAAARRSSHDYAEIYRTFLRRQELGDRLDEETLAILRADVLAAIRRRVTGDVPAGGAAGSR